MAAQHEALKKLLARERDMDISVTGRKSGRTITLPVWFVWADEQLLLLPAYGTTTQWYKNALKNPTITIRVNGESAQCRVVPITDPAAVSAVVDKFRAKYGASTVKQYYTTFDVVAVAEF